MHELWNRKNHQVMVIGEIFQWKSFDEVSNTARRNGSARLMLRRRWSLSTCVEKDVAPVGSRLASYRKKTTGWNYVLSWNRWMKGTMKIPRFITTPYTNSVSLNFWKSLLWCYFIDRIKKNFEEFLSIKIVTWIGKW